MVSMPQATPTDMKASGANQDSICNYGDQSTPSSNNGTPTNTKFEQFNAEIDPYEEQKTDNENQGFFSYRNEAIPFITISDETKLFEVHPQAVRLLESIQGEIGVVTIAGPYRTGKSSLAGRAFLNNPNAFRAGSTINPCTKGLWIYGTPITDCRSAGDGEQRTAVVIDTEGLNALDESQNHDLRILTLSVLLSSKLIYNSLNAIDEQSLQQLNLVVNLTKHIQLRTNQAAGEFQDPEELAKIFPSFLWVVRDFTLALVKQDGTAITPKEYLEIALQEQSGMSERTEVKNRTRRLFKSLFTERDCLTFERPIAEETQLQNLSEIPNEELNPVFLKQLETLRKRVLYKMQTKMFHGRAITGSVLVNLACQYVKAFNAGTVPNIESAWTYICRNESIKALAMARDQFKQVLDKKLVLPCSLQELEYDYKDAKREALQLYRQRVYSEDDSAKQGEETVRKECKDLYQLVKVQNEETCTAVCTQYLNKYHEELMKSLADQQSSPFDSQVSQEITSQPVLFGNLDQVEAALYQIEQNYGETGPKGEKNMRDLIFEKFRSQIAFESGQYFIRNMKRDGADKHFFLQEKCKSLEKKVLEAKQVNQTEIEELNQILKKRDKENYEVMAHIKIYQEQMQTLESEAEQSKLELQAKFDSEKAKLTEQTNDAMLSKEMMESELQRIKLSMIEVQSNADKEKALQAQEIAHIKQSNQELRKRESELAQELKESSQSNLDERKERESALQNSLNESLLQTQQANEKVQDLVEKLELAIQQNEEMQVRFSEENEMLKEKLSSSELQITLQNTAQSDDQSSKLQQMLDEANKSLEQACQKLMEQQEATKTAITNLSCDKDSIIAMKDKQIALQSQKESQLKENADTLAKQLEASKTENNKFLAAQLNMNSQGDSGLVEQQALLDSFQKTNQEERESLIEMHAQEKSSLTQELDETKQILEEHQLADKVQIVELQKQVDELADQVETLEVENQRLEKQYRAQRDRNESIIESMHSKSSQSVVELTLQHENQIRDLEQNLRETQDQAKQEFSKLKIAFENEKDQLTQKLQEDKDQMKEEERLLRQDFEERINEDEIKFDEERQYLQQSLSQLQFESKAQLDKTQRELLLLNNDHENLQAIHAEKVDQLRNLQESSEVSIQNLSRQHAEQAANLQVKIDSLSMSGNTKDQALITANLSLQHCQSDLARKRSQIDALEQAQKIDTEKLESKVSALRDENQLLKDKLQAKELIFSKEIALKEQTVEFLQNKISERQDVSKQRLRELEEQLANSKAEKQVQLADQSNNFNEQKLEIETKLKAKSGACKTLQAELHSKIPELERKKAVLSQKVEDLQKLVDQKNVEIQEKLDQQSQQMQLVQEQASAELKSALESTAEIKIRIHELEKENQSLMSEIEKDQALFDDKIKFLNEQKTRLEADKVESDRKLEETQDSLQRIRGQEKEKASKTRQECVTHLETYYKSLNLRIQEEAKKATEEQLAKVKVLQEQNQEMQTQLEIAKREKDASMKSYIERQGKQDKIEQNMRQELASMKNQIQETLIQNETKMEELKESTRLKIAKVEKERKEMEISQTQARHNFSIGEARWNMKSEQLQNDINQLNEEVQRLQTKNETLIRENQKIRTSHRAQLQQSKQLSSSSKILFEQSANFSSNRSSNIRNTMPITSQFLNGSSNPPLHSNGDDIAALAGLEETTQQEFESKLLQQQSNISSGRHTERYQMNQQRLTSSTSKSGMTKVATFSTKLLKQQPLQQQKSSAGGVSLLARSIREAQAKCSSPPQSREQSNPAQTGKGAVRMMKSMGLRAGTTILHPTQKPIMTLRPFRPTAINNCENRNTEVTTTIDKTKKRSPLLIHNNGLLASASMTSPAKQAIKNMGSALQEIKSNEQVTLKIEDEDANEVEKQLKFAVNKTAMTLDELILSSPQDDQDYDNFDQ